MVLVKYQILDEDGFFLCKNLYNKKVFHITFIFVIFHGFSAIERNKCVGEIMKLMFFAYFRYFRVRVFKSLYL